MAKDNQTPTQKLYQRFREELDTKKVSKGKLAEKLGISSQAFSTKIYNSKLVDLDFIYECKKHHKSLNINFILTGNLNNSGVEEFNLTYEEKLKRLSIIIEYQAEDNARLRNKLNDIESNQ